MPFCYLCGAKIPTSNRLHRRRVRTGDRFIRSRSTRRITGRNLTFGMRVVCSGCARRMDRQRDADQLVRNLGVLGLLLLLALILGLQ